jgi:serine/threonine protein kinase
MMTEPQRTCPSCGNELSGTMESCPVCMLRQALAGGVQSGESSSSEEAVKSTPEQAAQRFEHYELVKGEDGKPVELGRGAMGVTYKAIDVDLRCPVTLKVISERYLGDESSRLRFLREARAAASVRHPNVASVFHLGRTGSSYFYAMEFVEGETLEKLIKRSGRVEVKLALEIATQVAAGLASVHKQNLVHRDIKPNNIMVILEDGGAVRAKIIDLGLAKAVNEPGSQTAISIPGGFAGTPEFASPENPVGILADLTMKMSQPAAIIRAMRDRICVMRDGLIMQVADPLTLYRQPENLFIGSPPMNLLKRKVQRRDDGLFFVEAGERLLRGYDFPQLFPGNAFSFSIAPVLRS